MRILTDTERAALEAFQNGKLPPEQRRALEQQLQGDPAFRRAASEWLGLDAATGALREAHFAAQLADWQAGLPPAKALAWWQKQPLWRWGAALMLLAAVVFTLVKTIGSPGPERRYRALVAEHFRPERVPGFMMGNDPAPNISPGRRAYAFRRYDEAIPLLQAELAQSKPPDTALIVYLGCAYVAREQAGEALSVFQSLAASARYGEKAQWYLALAHLQAGDADAARRLLEGLMQRPGGAFGEEARGMLRAMEDSE